MRKADVGSYVGCSRRSFQVLKKVERVAWRHSRLLKLVIMVVATVLRMMPNRSDFGVVEEQNMDLRVTDSLVILLPQHALLPPLRFFHRRSRFVLSSEWMLMCVAIRCFRSLEQDVDESQALELEP